MSRRLLVIIGIAVLLLVAGMAARSRGDDTTTGEELIGTWTAHGVVKRPVPGLGQPAGTRIERKWTFYNRCNATRCQLYLDRETAGETQWAPVYEEDGHLVSVSDQVSAGCGGAPSRLTRNFTITPEGDDELAAVEGEYGQSDGCPATSISGQVDWTAEKTSDDCPAHAGCRDELASQ